MSIIGLGTRIIVSVLFASFCGASATIYLEGQQHRKLQEEYQQKYELELKQKENVNDLLKGLEKYKQLTEKYNKTKTELQSIRDLKPDRNIEYFKKVKNIPYESVKNEKIKELKEYLEKYYSELPSEELNYLRENFAEEFSDSKYFKKIYLTFDDGPGPYTERLLDILKKYNVKATFFILGNNIEGNEHILKRMVDEGHVLGNHSMTHRDFTTLSHDEIVHEIESVNKLLSPFQKEIVEFRPPYGALNDEVRQIVDEMGMKIVLWNIDSEDWKNRDSKITEENILNSLNKNSTVILTHDIHESTVNAMESIIQKMFSKGYIFINNKK